MNITRISIERPTIAIVIFSLLIILGMMSYRFLNYELVPEFNPPVITVTTVYPGASPREVENSVSKPVEDALSSLENIETITSTSMESFSLVKLEMKAGTDIKNTLREADRKINGILGELPSQAQKPTLTRFDFNDLPVMRMGTYSSLSPEDFYDFARNQIVPVLNQIEGVAQVRLLGGVEREVQVKVDPQKMAANNVSLLQVIQIIQRTNLEIPAGKVESEERQNFIRFSGRFESVEEIKDLVVFEIPQIGKKVYIKDIADVTFYRKEQTVIAKINGKEALALDIRKQSDANAVEMSTTVRERLDELSVKFQDINLVFDIAQDTSQFTIKAADAVITDLTYAVILVSLVMLIFLHSLRNSLIVLVSIPTSIISTFTVMYLLGYSLNLLTLLGLSLSIGILVDDSIVVLENIHKNGNRLYSPVDYDDRCGGISAHNLFNRIGSRYAQAIFGGYCYFHPIQFVCLLHHRTLVDLKVFEA
jgi:multidrug efflux pump subunit AcrB